MALIKAGWFQTTWFPDSWWHQDYWLEYGVSVPVTGGDSTRYYYIKKPRRKDKKPLLLTIQKLLTALKGE